MSSQLIADFISHRRAIFASRFLRPPGRFKRAQLREKPRRRIGPFENPVRRFVRLREKARNFCEIPPPRRIPIPKPTNIKFLQSVDGVPKVKAEVLQKRLSFLLSEKAKLQQMAAKMQMGDTPYQVEFYTWMRQMRDLRKIYRAQYLQRLAEVTEEEKYKQLQLYHQEQREKSQKRQEIRRRIYEDKKRRSILKDRLRIEQKVTQTIQMSRQSRKKKAEIYYLDKLQKKAEFITDENVQQKLGERQMEIFTRNVSVPDILRHLGHNDEPRFSSKSTPGVDNIFRSIMEESFALLPEDEPQFEEEENTSKGKLSGRQRAHVMYSGFTEEEKLKLLDEKIDLLNRKIDEESTLKGAPQNLLLVQLRDQLDAAKRSYLEKSYAAQARKEAESSRDEKRSEDEDGRYDFKIK